MRDDLLTYYERELTFVRRMAVGFAEEYPKIAGRLLLEPGKSEDPHVERLIEAFAFLASRIHLKIDDEFPEITESLLQILYPHYLSPIPSMSVVQFALDPTQGKLASGFTIDRHRRLFSKPGRDTRCEFRTCYPVTLWPIEVEAVRLDAPGPIDAAGKQAAAALTLSLKSVRDVKLKELEIDRLRFFLSGESGSSQLEHRLYEIVFGHTVGVELRREGTPPIPLGADAIREVGFEKDEGMLPYSSRSFLGYRLVQEYFHFPEKFLFFDVTRLGALKNFDQQVDLVLLLDQVPKVDQKLEPKHFRLGCTPVVNLFSRTAEPIRLDHSHVEYRVVPDERRPRTTEVYSVNRVTSLPRGARTPVEFHPFYSFKHSFDRQKVHTFWHAMRRPSERKDDHGTEVFVTLVNLDFRPTQPANDVVVVEITATNRDLPGMLPFGNDPDGDFEIENAAPVRRVHCLTKPTRTIRPPRRYGAQWRLISHLSLNFLSPVEGGDDRDPEVLREILKLYDFGDSAAVQQQILGLSGVSSRQVWRRVRSSRGSGFARGIEATLEFDETAYVGSGVFLFASVLEKFLGLYVSINSFSETVATTKQRGELKRWPPRSGYQPLL
jgi:type VI secretion system protein ImpG